MISLTALVYTVVGLIIIALVWWLLNWLVDYCKVPEPFNRIARVVLAILAVLVVIGILLSLVTGTPVFRP